jgi:hypothetical protein
MSLLFFLLLSFPARAANERITPVVPCHAEIVQLPMNPCNWFSVHQTLSPGGCGANQA